MLDVDIEVTGSCITIDFGRTGLHIATLKHRAEEVLPLLFSLVSADDTWLNLSEEEQLSRTRAWLAMDMMCQAATLNATRGAELLGSIAGGEESIADHGFPEFASGQDGNA